MDNEELISAAAALHKTLNPGDPCSVVHFDRWLRRECGFTYFCGFPSKGQNAGTLVYNIKVWDEKKYMVFLLKI